MDHRRLGSHFVDRGKVFMKCETTIERIPTTYYKEETTEGKKAA